MVEPINPLSQSPGNYAPLSPAARTTAGEKAQSEFMTIFYKEMLKQVFSTPNLSPLSADEPKSDFAADLNHDLLIDQMAEQMAKQAVASRTWPIATEGVTK